MLIIISILSSFTILSLKPEIFKNQVAYFILGFIIYFLVAKIHPSYFQYFSKLFYVASVLILALTLIAGVIVRGSVRWIDLGIVRFQPSEIVKPFLIVFFANELSHLQNNLKFFLREVIFFAIMAILIFKQPDFGNFLVYSLIFATMIFFSRIKTSYVVLFFAVVLLIIPVTSLFLRQYQRDRIAAFLNPGFDPQGISYHQIQSIISVGSGGLTGQGIGRGTQTHLLFLPEKETDFVFASFAEEFGFVGSFVLLSGYFFLFFKLIRLMSGARREFDRLLLVGVFGYLFFQTFIHVGMNIGILPVTGITLPLFSAGGSSITSVLFTLGLVAFYERGVV